MSGIIGDVANSQSDIIGKKPFAFFGLSGTQASSNGTVTKIAFDVAFGGSVGGTTALSSNGYLVPISGYYFVSLHVSTFDANNDVNSQYIKVLLDSVIKFGDYNVSNVSVRHVGSEVSGVLFAAAGQIIYGYVQHHSATGGALIYHDGGTAGNPTTCINIQFLGK
jgi:hypothetical protein|tara:strand:+ start:637 stop:1131 length:495 start_codon:yes stop_codon:yes gene_type:complete